MSSVTWPTDDFLERSAFATPSVATFLTENAIIADRFRIGRLLGSGGMGDVYSAFDMHLEAPVALKTIRPEIASDAAAVTRFRSEVLRARTVTHPNVCRVHDLFVHGDSTAKVYFLSMALLEGETLAQRLQRDGALPADLCTGLALQIASALDEAHRRGIIHRDLKPANVMLVGDPLQPDAVVTDFGLAGDFTSSSDNEPHGRAGTRAYMAPELIDGGAITPACDAFAFGVLAHEMLTYGRPAASAADLPRRWQVLIEKCVSERPEDRPTGLVEAMRVLAPRSAPTTSWLVLLLTLVATVALNVPLLRSLKQGSEPGHSGAALLMADVVNATGEPDLDAITEMLHRQVEQSRYISFVPSTDRRNAASEQNGDALSAQRAREMVWRGTADAYVSGRIWRGAGAYGLTVRIEGRASEPSLPAKNWSRTYEARNRAELFSRLRDAAAWIRSVSGEATNGITDTNRPVEDVTSSSWQALQMFSKAESFFAMSQQDDGLALLAESTRLDADFALAWMRMGDILVSRGDYEQGYISWKRALTVSKKRQLLPREEYRLRGLFASDTHDFAEAERVYRLWIVSYPGDSLPRFYIARPLLMLGRTGEAISMLRAAWQLDPESTYIPVHLAMFLLRAGQIEQLAAVLNALDRRGLAAWADCIRGQASVLSGDYESAMVHFKALEDSDDRLLRGRATVLEASLFAERGQYDLAIAALDRGMSSDAAAGDQTARADKLIARAYLTLRTGQRGACRDLCIQAKQADHSSRRLAQIGSLLARAGYSSDAEEIARGFDPESPIREVQVDRLRLTGEILLARAHPRLAWDTFQKAAALDAPGVPHEYLARGAAAAGETGTATALYRRMASDPNYYWHYPDAEPPGVWGDALSHYIRLASRAGEPADLATFQKRLTKLRAPFRATHSEEVPGADK